MDFQSNMLKEPLMSMILSKLQFIRADLFEEYCSKVFIRVYKLNTICMLHG